MTAMMWNALTHSYIVANPRDQTFHMGDRRVRQDAVAKVENKRMSPERFEDGVDRMIECCPTGEQHQRIKIALNGAQRLNVVARELQFRHPVEPHSVDRHGIQIALQLRAGTTRKANNSRRRKMFTYAR